MKLKYLYWIYKFSKKRRNKEVVKGAITGWVIGTTIAVGFMILICYISFLNAANEYERKSKYFDDPTIKTMERELEVVGRTEIYPKHKLSEVEHEELIKFGFRCSSNGIKLEKEWKYFCYGV